MLSKFVARKPWLAVLAAVFVLSGCSMRGCALQINETPPETEVLDLGEGCLNGVSDTLHHYFDGKSSEREVNRIFKCASKSLQLFSKRTKGAEDGRFSAKELKRFLEKNFLDGNFISDGLMSDFMTLKQSFLGGSTQDLTLDEIDGIGTLIEVLRTQAVNLLPFQPLTKQNLLSLKRPDFDRAMVALVEAGKTIGNVIQEKGTIYTFVQLERFMFEIERIYPDKENPRYLRSQLSFLETLKFTLIGEPADRFVGDDLSRLFKIAAGWLAVKFQASFFNEVYYQNSMYSGFKWMTGDSFSLLSRMLNDATSLLEDAVMHHSGESISFEALDKFIDESFTEQDFKTISISKQTLKEFLRPLFERILGPQSKDRVKRVNGGGFDRWVIKRLKNIISEWETGQKWLETVFFRLDLKRRTPLKRYSRDEILNEINLLLTSASSGSRSQDDLRTFFLNMNNEPRASSEIKDAIKDNQKKILAELGYNLNRWPYFLNDEAPLEVTFPERGAVAQYSLSNLAYMNLLIRMISIPMVGYGGAYSEFVERNGSDRLLSVYGLSESELGRLDTDLRQVMIDIKWLHPTRIDVYKARFLEGNNFTFVSTGDPWLMIEEGAQLLSFMISSKKLGARLHQFIGDFCKKEGAILMDPEHPGQELLDFYGGIQIRKDCYWKYFESEIAFLKHNMPTMVGHFLSLSEDSKTPFFSSLETVMNGSSISPVDVIDSSDAESLVGVLQYIEAIFARHDLDGSSLMNQEEAEKAFPVFRYTLKEIAGKKGFTKDEDVLALYLCLIEYGREPSWYEWLTWRKGQPFNSGRNKMLRIFQKFSE